MKENKTMDEWVKKQTREIKVKLWGEETIFTPEICSTIIGNGRQLI